MGYSTGDEKLDVLLDGGIPEGKNILVCGPPGEIKKAFILEIAAQSTKHGKHAVIIDFDEPIDKIKEEIKDREGDLSKLIVVDGYSWSLGVPSNNRYNLQSPNALNDLAIILSNISNTINRGFLLVYYSLSTVLLYNEVNETYRFLQTTSAKLKEKGATSLFLVEEGMHPEDTMITIEHLMDDKYTFKKSGTSWKLRIKSMDDFPITVEYINNKVKIP